MNNMRQLGFGFIRYCDSNGGAVPWDGGDGTSATPVTQCSSPNGPTVHLTWDDNSLWWNGVLSEIGIDYYSMQIAYQTQKGGPLPGLNSDSVLICPAMKTVGVTASDTGITVDGNGHMMLYGAPSGAGGKGSQILPMCMSYVINSKLKETQPVQKIVQLEPSTSVAIFVEKRMSPGEIPKTDIYYSQMVTKNLGQQRAEHYRFTCRHRTGGFICFVDGHVAWFSFDELNTPFETTPVLDYNNTSKVVWDPFGPESG
jgi:prepilin-type processing-associated H-X9-DG protein